MLYSTGLELQLRANCTVDWAFHSLIDTFFDENDLVKESECLSRRLVYGAEDGASFTCQLFQRSYQ